MWSPLQHFVDLMYPRLCLACSCNLFAHERHICLRCLYQLPKTYFHDMPNNPLEQLFWGRFDVQAVTSFLYFTKGGIAQQMLHKLKYQGRKEVGLGLGKMLGQELRHSPRFRDAELVVPVPLHPKRERLRGYNQSMLIALGISESMEVSATAKMLTRPQYTETQTRKGRFERWENVAEAFVCPKPELLRGKRLLLVDDVLTTGATLEACARVLERAGAQVCMATLACAVR